jgi:hypothetical protein
MHNLCRRNGSPPNRPGRLVAQTSKHLLYPVGIGADGGAEPRGNLIWRGNQTSDSLFLERGVIPLRDARRVLPAYPREPRPRQ